jgi:hypothetical protein
MTDPERAIEQARQAAASMRAEGSYQHDTERAAPPAPTGARLSEWAVIHPDMRSVRSLRRFGAPLTAFKRALLRLLAQYHAELTAQQSRFNVKLVEELQALERRVEALEERLGESDSAR